MPRVEVIELNGDLEEVLMTSRQARERLGPEEPPPRTRNRKTFWPKEPPFVSPWYQESSFPSLSEYLHSLSLKQQLLGEKFVFFGGPAAIFRRVAEFFSEAELRASLEDWENNDIFTQPILTAVGIAFERLAYLWLKEHPGRKETLLDPGSCSRIFADLRRKNRGFFVPDGMIITHGKETSIIKALCEYKTNPDSQKTQLEEQIRKFQGFISAFKDQKIPLWVSLDTVRRFRSKFLTVAKDCQIILVIPANRGLAAAYEGVNVFNLPFSSRNMGEIGQRSLFDALKIRTQAGLHFITEPEME